nr:hypothetical protein [Thalassomonas actiniarum]
MTTITVRHKPITPAGVLAQKYRKPYCNYCHHKAIKPVFAVPVSAPFKTIRKLLQQSINSRPFPVANSMTIYL